MTAFLSDIVGFKLCRDKDPILLSPVIPKHYAYHILGTQEKNYGKKEDWIGKEEIKSKPTLKLHKWP